MARPKTQITHDNVFYFLEYFENGLNKAGKLYNRMGKDVRYEARSEFTELRNAYYLAKDDSKEGFPTKLQEWVDTHLSKENWDQCLATFRQKKFHRDNKRYVVKLRVEAYVALEQYAKAVNLPLGEAVHQAVKKENDRLFEESQK